MGFTLTAIGQEKKFNDVRVKGHIRFGENVSDTGVMKRIGYDLYYYKSDTDSIQIGEGGATVDTVNEISTK